MPVELLAVPLHKIRLDRNKENEHDDNSAEQRMVSCLRSERTRAKGAAKGFGDLPSSKVEVCEISRDVRESVVDRENVKDCNERQGKSTNPVQKLGAEFLRTSIEIQEHDSEEIAVSRSEAGHDRLADHDLDSHRGRKNELRAKTDFSRRKDVGCFIVVLFSHFSRPGDDEPRKGLRDEAELIGDEKWSDLLLCTLERQA